MDDFEDSYRDAINAGESNLAASKLLKNWCFHAELVRSSGRGMIEAETGLPIGHMGVQCKYSKKSSMLSWLLEDGVYDFYQSNCKNCEKRLPVGLPNILTFVEPREKAAEMRKKQREDKEQLRITKQANRRQERASFRYELFLEETFVLDLLDELDSDSIAQDDPRLEQLANLAPETFTPRVISHLLSSILNEHLPYSISAAKALLHANLELKDRLSVAVFLICNNVVSKNAIEVVLSGLSDLSRADFISILRVFVLMAVKPPPEASFGGFEQRQLDSAPILSLFAEKKLEIGDEVASLFRSEKPRDISTAVEIILATDSHELLEKNIRSIFTKLMRRRTLLPRERRDSRVLYYLREAASKCLENFPDETDRIILALLKDKDDFGRNEAYNSYKSVLRDRYEDYIHIGNAQRIAFKRLLWAAIERPDDSRDEAVGFFRYPSKGLAMLAAEHFDDLIGAAAILSEKYEQVDKKYTVEVTENMLAHMERRNKRNTINGLQGSLIAWAVIGAKHKGREGIEQFLALYRRLPENQTRMRGNMISHISSLLTGLESLQLVLSDWYRALMDESTFVRANAASAWENVPHELIKNFPDLFFESFSVLLSDSYIYVHQSALHAIRRCPFPQEKRHLNTQRLWGLVLHYSKKSKDDDFVVDCIEVLESQCLSSEERLGKPGQILSSILMTLEEGALYHAVNRLRYSAKDIPGFVKVALKSIQNPYTRSISIDDCVSVILAAPDSELRKCVEDLNEAFENLKPFKPENYVEALLYAAALTKVGHFTEASTHFSDWLSGIPVEDRTEHWRLEASLITVASQIEGALGSGAGVNELIEEWGSILSNLEKENEERSKHRDFPPSFFFED